MARYDLTDEEWVLIEPLLPPRTPRQTRLPLPVAPSSAKRHFLDSAHGAPWRDLPERYGPWTTVYDRFRRWRNSGLWQTVLNALEAQARKMDRIDFEFAALDGSVVRARKAAAGAKKGALRPRKAANNKR